jgi:hypothetical protein
MHDHNVFLDAAEDGGFLGRCSTCGWAGPVRNEGSDDDQHDWAQDDCLNHIGDPDGSDAVRAEADSRSDDSVHYLQEGQSLYLEIIGYMDDDGTSYHFLYFEGVSGKLASTDPDGNGFFMFEEPFAVGAVELMRLGFTAQQIEEAL